MAVLPLEGFVVGVTADRRAAEQIGLFTSRGADVLHAPVATHGACRPAEAESRPVGVLLDAISRRDVDAVTFTRGVAVSELLAAARKRDQLDDVLAAFNHGDVAAACLGVVCAEHARSCGIVHPVASQGSRLRLLAVAVTETLASRRHEARVGSTLIVLQGRVVDLDGMRVRLTPSEAAVLRMLLSRPGAVLSKQAILRSHPRQVTEHALEATIGRLRRRLGPAGAAVRSVRGRGYRFDSYGDELLAGPE